MITADAARKLAAAKLRAVASEEIETIEKKIIQSADDGNLAVSIDKISHEAELYFISLGFKVKETCTERRYGNEGSVYVTMIEWNSTR